MDDSSWECAKRISRPEVIESSSWMANMDKNQWKNKYTETTLKYFNKLVPN